MPINTQQLNQLIFDCFSGKMRWIDGASVFPLPDLIEAFFNTRAAFRRLLDDLTDAQAAYHEPNNPMWSISEAVTHLIYSQNFYYNQLLDITTSQLPHVLEAARGFGEGAKLAIPADELRTMLDSGTAQLRVAIDATLPHQDPAQTTTIPFFGECNYATWILLLLAHEVDHYRQAVVMRRLAKAASPNEMNQIT